MYKPGRVLDVTVNFIVSLPCSVLKNIPIPRSCPEISLFRIENDLPFLARLESGARGAEMLDLDDLLTGLIIEDQNVIPSALARLGLEGQFMDSPEH